MNNLEWLCHIMRMIEDKETVGVEHIIREYVFGLYMRRILYHFEDNAHDCGFPLDVATILNRISRCLLDCDKEDMMFSLAVQYLEIEE